jgi:hypothetical protein
MEAGDRQGPSTRSRSAKQPEDRNINKKSQKTKVTEVSDEEESETEDEVAVVPPPRKTKIKKVRIAEPNVSQINGRNDRVDFPYIEVPALPSVSRADHNNATRVNPIPINASKRGPAYKTKSPIEDKNKEEAVIAKVLDNPVTLTTAELMGSSKPIRDGIKNMLTPKRKSTGPEELTLLHSMPYAQPEETDEESEEDDGVYLKHDALHVDNIVFDSFFISDHDRGGIPKGSIICGDPVLQYLESLPPGEEPKQLFVGKESASLRTVYPVINGVAAEETVLDGGSQIVSMDKEIALGLDISWDPDIVIHMQSANKQVE